METSQRQMSPEEKAREYIRQSFSLVGLHVEDLEADEWQHLVNMIAQILFDPHRSVHLGGDGGH